MPCIYEDFGASERVKEQDLNNRTKWLCSIFGQLEKAGELSNYQISKAAKKWWNEHKEFDEQRRAKDAENKIIKAKKKAALAKLSPDERKLLGFDATTYYNK